MRILVVAPALHGTSPGQRFRIEQWAPHLERQGFSFRYEPFEDQSLHDVLYRPGHHAEKAARMLMAFGRRLRTLRAVGDADLIYLYREASLIGPAVIETMLARKGVPLVYDFDDPIWLPYRSPTNGVFSALKAVGKTARICRLASAVTVGNRLLAGYARKHSANVHVFPSTVELDNYPTLRSARVTCTPTVGWTGSHSTLPFLRLLDEPLKALKSTESFRMLVISHTTELEWPGLEDVLILRQWNAETEFDDLSAMDIGLAPFPDTGWTPWRCHGKVLQYMAAGIPVVASPIGILPDFIKDGVNGFLAATTEDWVARIAMLIHDPDLRQRMGAAGRQTVEQQFAAGHWARKLGTLFRSLAR